MSKLLNIQLSAFVKKHIEHSNIVELMTELNNIPGGYVLLPNVIQGQNVDLMKGEMTSIFNISFVSTDSAVRIVCMDERIDCTLSFENSEPKNIMECLDYAKNVVKLILNKFSITSNRLALNINELSEGTVDKDIDIRNNTSFSKIITTLDYCNDKVLNEWATRSNVRVPITINGESEILNVITELNLVKNQKDLKQKILWHADINTIAEHSDYRFDDEDIDSFVSEAINIADEIKNSFKKVDVINAE